MSLIKCPKCGKEISGKEGKCFNCGCEFEVVKKYYCDQCGTEIKNDTIKCPKCNQPTNSKNNMQTVQQQTPTTPINYDEINKAANEKVHNELISASQIILILGSIGGFITMLIGFGNEVTGGISIAYGITLIIGSYISTLFLRWMAAVQRQLQDIQNTMK